MPVTSSLQNEWRFPPGGDTLSLRDVQYSPSRKENATHGQVYGTGRTRVKLHGGRGGPERATVALSGGPVVETNAGALIRVLRGISGTRHLCL
jgi:hypothetical protein